VKINRRFEWVYVILTIFTVALLISKADFYNSDSYYQNSFLTKALLSAFIFTLIIRDSGSKLRSLGAWWVHSLAAVGMLACAIYLSVSAMNFDISRAEMFFFLGQNFMTAVIEEGLFRVYLFFRLFKFFENSKDPFRRALLLSSILFSLCHLIMVFRLEFDLFSAISYLFIAFSLGILLQIIFISTKSILWPIAIHFSYNALIHFSAFSYSTSGVPKDLSNTIPSSTLQSLLSLILFTLIGGVIILFSKTIHRARADENLRFINQVKLN